MNKVKRLPVKRRLFCLQQRKIGSLVQRSGIVIRQDHTPARKSHILYKVFRTPVRLFSTLVQNNCTMCEVARALVRKAGGTVQPTCTYVRLARTIIPLYLPISDDTYFATKKSIQLKTLIALLYE